MWLYPSPRATAMALERRRPLPAGASERFAGYGVISLPFASGDVLAFRRMVASSIGPPYDSIWHRDSAGRWTFYTNVQPDRGCPRFFGDGFARLVVDEVRIEWTGPAEITVSAPADRLHWTLRLAASPATRAANVLARLLPASDRNGAGRVLAPLITSLLGAGRFSLSGLSPSGHTFCLAPREIWRIDGSAATIRGNELGLTKPLARQARLADFWLPNSGIFAFGYARFSKCEE